MIRKFLKESLSFSRRERNGIIILLAVLGLLILTRLLLPVLFEPDLSDPSEFAEELKSVKKDTVEMLPPEEALFMFDPNQVGIEDLRRLGLSESVSRTLIRYREKGGRFESEEDIKKIYGFTDMDYQRLAPYIVIKPLIVLPEIEMDSFSGSGQTAPKSVPFVLFDLNSADTSRLLKIVGIGPVLSQRIIKYRELLGGFAQIDQLSEVYGLDEQTCNELSGQIYIDTTLIRKIDLNRAELSELAQHPYLDLYQAGALVSYRELKGRFSGMEEILKNKLLKEEDYLKILPYLIINEGNQ